MHSFVGSSAAEFRFVKCTLPLLICARFEDALLVLFKKVCRGFGIDALADCCSNMRNQATCIAALHETLDPSAREIMLNRIAAHQLKQPTL